MSTPASLNESTPLLTHTVERSTQLPVNASAENQGELVSNTGSMQPIDKTLLRMVATTLVIGILEFVMLCADFLIRKYCSTRFGTSSFWFVVSWPTYLLVVSLSFLSTPRSHFTRSHFTRSHFTAGMI
jgi:hypothetical protein